METTVIASNSKGECLFCKEMIDKKDISKHLAYHLTQMAKESKDNETQNFCHIRVEAEDLFLELLVKGNEIMKTIDRFLRDIWLDCCGHMSNFGHKQFKVKMKDPVEIVFDSSIKIFHDYDFGSTTRVFLKGLKHYQLDVKEKITLLSRNEPLPILCSMCQNKIATDICTVCNFDVFCKKCGDKHEKSCSDFGEYSKMPIVNSPRMGECGYEGGHIDLERDGIYTAKLPI